MAVRPFHGGNTGSNLVRDAKQRLIAAAAIKSFWSGNPNIGCDKSATLLTIKLLLPVVMGVLRRVTKSRFPQAPYLNSTVAGDALNPCLLLRHADSFQPVHQIKAGSPQRAA